ncbi:kelch-like protein 5 isoform X1 [Syngnathus acus]|uniref:kelch-like protein 5 isoform X1 n=2 Tax=Syngnathus acus TaxID=161584 RepID=UPI001885E86E|nr:kelch-like protein 5 isoform X1 [Syngnathus acus]
MLGRDSGDQIPRLPPRFLSLCWSWCSSVQEHLTLAKSARLSDLSCRTAERLAPLPSFPPPRPLAVMSSGSSNSSSRKEFDVKQILRIRWRWFGHPAVPPPHSPPLRDYLAGRRSGGHSSPSEGPSSFSGGGSNSAGVGSSHGGLVTSGSAGSNLCSSRKFVESSGSRGGSGGAGATANSCSRSASQPECRSSPAAWASPPPRRRSRPVSNMEPFGEAPVLQLGAETSARAGGDGEAAASTEENNNHPDTDSSSCRTSNSTATLSSCMSMEPCACPEEGLFTALSHADITFRKMEGYLRSRQLCDVTLVAGDRQIPAHRLVLSSVSDYFAAMFTSDVREAKQDEVKMEGVDPDALWTLVQYAYTGRLELREDTIESLLSASCLLQLSSAVQACCSFLMKQLHPSNCLGISSYANAQGCHDLQRAAHTYTMEHFVEVIGAQEFMLLPVDEMERLLMSDDINVPDEETVVTALLTWVTHDVAARQRHLPSLLAHVRLPLLQPQFLADLETRPMLRDSVDCQRLLMEGMKYHLLPQCRPLLQSPRTRPRKATVGAMFAVGGMDATKGATSIEQYCLRRDKWKQVATMSGRRLQFAVAVLDGRLYVVGGRDGLKTLNTVECYNPQCKTWSVMPPISTHRHGLGVAVLEGPMYAVGGHDGWSYLSTVERWDPQARQWSFVASMATPRSTVGVAVLNNKLYAVGGRDGSSCLRSVECFDPHTNRWNDCAPMAKRRGGVGVATWHGFLYAIGGHDAPASSLASRLSDCVERYDPQTDVWTTVAPMSISRDAVGVCLLGDRLYAVGGYDGQMYLNTVEAYDPQTNEWSQVAPLCLGRAGASVVVVKM